MTTKNVNTVPVTTWAAAAPTAIPIRRPSAPRKPREEPTRWEDEPIERQRIIPLLTMQQLASFPTEADLFRFTEQFALKHA